MAHGRMTRRHRLTVHADLLPQPTRDARLRVREFDPLCANPAAATNDAALAIDERDRMGCPRQIIPGPLLHRSHAARASPTSTARVALPAAFQMHPKSTGPRVVRTLKGLHPKSGHAQNPRTIAPRSHASSLVGSTSRENDTGWSGAKRDQHCRRPGRRADRPLIRGPRRRPGNYVNSCRRYRSLR